MSTWDSVAKKVNFNINLSKPELLKFIPTKSRVLDFGCGYGRISKKLNALGYREIVGIDSSENMIRRGSTEHPHLDLRFSNTDILPFSNSEFDAVITCAVFTCIDDSEFRKHIFRELARVLKRNGVIYMAEFSSLKSTKFRSQQGIPMWHSCHSELEQLAFPMTLLCSKQEKTITMSGNPSLISHIIAQKQYR